MSILTPFRRLFSAVAVTMFMVGAAAAQPSASEPEFVPYTNDLQFFEQPDLSRYGNGVRPATGWFGSAEYINWSIQAPGNTTIGNPAVGVTQVFSPGTRTFNTGAISTTNFNTTINPNITFISNSGGIFGSSGVNITVTINGQSVTTTGIFTAQIPMTITYPGDTTTASVQTIETGVILNNTGAPQINSMTTGALGSDFTSGGRFEFGRIADDRGWFVSTFNLGTQTQNLSGVDVAVNFVNQPVGFIDIRGGRVGTPPVGTYQNFGFAGDGFDDDLDGDGVFGRFGRDRGTQLGQTFFNPMDGIPDFENPGSPLINVDFDDAVPLPTVFHDLEATNRTSLYGVEAQRLWRLPFSPRGGMWEVFTGPRYIRMRDSFFVTARGIDTNPQYYMNPIADAEWNTTVDNNVFGGQIGGRWQYQRDRWALNLESRFFGAANFQNMKQQGSTATRANLAVPTPGGGGQANPTVPFRDDVVNMQLGHGFQSGVNDVVFSPVGEFRASLKYQVFRSVYVTLGYNATYIANVARAAKLVNYRLPDFGILEHNNKQDVFINGLNLGVIINR